MIPENERRTYGSGARHLRQYDDGVVTMRPRRTGLVSCTCTFSPKDCSSSGGSGSSSSALSERDETIEREPTINFSIADDTRHSVVAGTKSNYLLSGKKRHFYRNCVNCRFRYSDICAGSALILYISIITREFSPKHSSP